MLCEKPIFGPVVMLANRNVADLPHVTRHQDPIERRVMWITMNRLFFLWGYLLSLLWRDNNAIALSDYFLWGYVLSLLWRDNNATALSDYFLWGYVLSLLWRVKPWERDQNATAKIWTYGAGFHLTNIFYSLFFNS